MEVEASQPLAHFRRDWWRSCLVGGGVRGVGRRVGGWR